MILEENEKINIGDRTYPLRFTVKSVFYVEKELGESILVTLAKLQNGQPFPLNTAYTLLKWAVSGGGIYLSEKEMDRLFLQVMNEQKLVLVEQIVLKALAKSGVIGNPKKIMAAVKRAKKV